jgi:hypothetical protein
MSSIFTTETIPKSTVYQRIKDLLVGAGWANISSKPSTDFDVFYSKGVADDKELYFQLQDSGFSTSGSTISARLINKYTPGAEGVAGTFDSIKTGEAFKNLYPVAYSPGIGVPADSMITFSYTVNLDRIIFVCEPPLSLGIYPNIVYLGAMSLYGTEVNSRSVILSQTLYIAAFANSNSVVVSGLSYTDTSPTTFLTTYRINTLSEYNNNDVRMLSEIAVGSANEGFRGKLDGLYVLNVNSSTRTAYGDILTDGTNTYKVLPGNPTSWGYNAMISANVLYAIQVS